MPFAMASVSEDESGCTVGTFGLGDTTAGTDPHPGELAIEQRHAYPKASIPCGSIPLDTDVTVVHRRVSQPMRT